MCIVRNHLFFVIMQFQQTTGGIMRKEYDAALERAILSLDNDKIEIIIDSMKSMEFHSFSVKRAILRLDSADGLIAIMRDGLNVEQIDYSKHPEEFAKCIIDARNARRAIFSIAEYCLQLDKAKTAKAIVGDVIITLLFALVALIALGGILKFLM